MDKLKLAHEYAMVRLTTSNPATLDEIIALSWYYADAMQDEADGRVNKERPDVLKEWQPDWSKAPKSMNYFFMNKDGSKYWTVNKPDKPNLSEHVMDCLECGGDCYAYASSQDYQGNWQDSLRKRP